MTECQQGHHLGWLAVYLALAAALAAFPLSVSSRQSDEIAPPKLAAPVYIDAYGDSTQQGLMVIDGKFIVTKHSQANEMQRILRERFPGVRVWEEGVGGTTLKQLINGTDGAHQLTLEQLLNRSVAHIVISNFGINDSSLISVREYIRNVDYFVTEARKRGKVPVLDEPNPVCDGKRKNIPALHKFVLALDRYAMANDVTLVRQYNRIRSQPNWTLLLSDCVHPNEVLYRLKAERLAEALTPLIERMLARP